MNVPGEERIRGALLGLAWGDVFGCPVESWRTRHIAAVYGRYDRLPDEYPLEKIASLGPKFLKRLRPLGLYPDDTQQCLALLQVCLSREGWSRETWAALLVEGLQRHAWRGYGRNFWASVARLSRGEPPQRSGNPTAGIGSVMRIGPVGAFYRDQPDLLARAVLEASFTTHGDIRSGAFAYAVAWTVAALIKGKTPADIISRLPGEVARQEQAWLEGHADWTMDRSAGALVSRTLQAFFAEPITEPHAIRERVSAPARFSLPPGFTVAHPNQGYVLLGGLHALAVGLTAPEPMAALVEMVAQGYDTDTVAAIAGSILGARFGSRWIPRDRLLDRGVLEAYAEALVTRAELPEDQQSFLQREAAWTRAEEEYQKSLGQGWRGT